MDSSQKPKRVNLRTLACSECSKLFDVSHHGRETPDGYATILRGMASGCTLCKLVFDAFENYKTSCEELPRFIHIMDSNRLPNQQLVYIWRVKEKPKSFMSTTVDMKSIHLSLLPSGHPNISNISPNPLSDTCHELVQTWMSECMRRHKSCNTMESWEMPKRLIDIGKSVSDIPKLISPTSKLTYAALSHVWGKFQINITTGHNVTSRTVGIPPSQIAKTFEDAIKVTRWLGIRFLWIDTLCIVQDDKEEWDIEASKMADIYCGCSVVIAASHSKDSRSGFLGFRGQPKRLTLHSESTGETPLFAYRDIDHEHWGGSTAPDGLMQEPLQERAWCYQERLLGPRVLYFGERELFFQCREGNNCECAPTEMDFSESHRWMLQHRSLPSVALSGEPCDDASFTDIWSSIVCDYSYLDLTYEGDHLPALSGIAKLANRLNFGRYIAGMWEKFLVYQLLWRPVNTNLRSKKKIGVPTFSWISWFGQVQYFNLFEQATSVSQVEKIFVTQAGHNPFGQISSATIQIKGKLIPLVSFRIRIQLIRSKGALDAENGIAPDDEEPTLLFDHDVQGSWDELSFLSLLQEKDDSRTFEGLILQSTEVLGEYIRAGIGLGVPPSWMTDCESASLVRII